ncbi:hypothetical protein GU926_08980 [Nibribacter ruber]|uniref:Carboxypeptidase-like regulatory domain-containing protein n=1 Tax=Nibribacter ruber TaxID=2698458 RepID=A0A6P1NYS4_9BACT|nr:carboxypeptidase-like regulatory domain-containing protein [Nibribacter ruber]QHL87564.1 hypothetical protein GU926_08980 [Nibribacter ruber]
MNLYVRFLICFCFCLVAGGTLCAQTQDPSLWVSGQVLRQIDKTPIAGVSVFSKKTGMGAATDAEGRFRMQIVSTDTLVFRALGYRQRMYVPALRSVTELRVNILLQEESVQLKEVQVGPVATPEKVDRVLRNMKPRAAIPKPRMNPMVPRVIIPPTPQSSQPPSPLMLLSSPLNYLWEQFSKDGKQRRRVALLMEEQELEKAARRESLRQDSLRQARLRYNRFFRDTVSFYPRW